MKTSNNIEYLVSTLIDMLVETRKQNYFRTEILNEFRNNETLIANVLNDKFLEYVKDNYSYDYNITEDKQIDIFYINDKLEQSSISKTKKDGMITIALYETPIKLVDGKYFIKTKTLIVCLDNAMLKWINYEKTGAVAPVFKSFYYSKKKDISATLRHELEHVASSSDNSFMNLLNKKIQLNFRNRVQLRYAKICLDLAKKRLNCFKNYDNSRSFESMIKKHGELLNELEIPAYVTDIKITAEKSKRVDEIFDIMEQYIIYDDFVFDNISYEDYITLEKYVVYLNCFVLKYYIKAMLLKYPETKKSLQHHIFRILSKSLYYNFKIGKLELLEADK